MGPLFAGFDAGTQSTKGLVLDVASGEIVARASCAYGLLEGLPAGAAEQHPSTWVDALGAVSAELARVLGPTVDRVAGIGVSGQQHGLVVLDAADRVVRPAKLWCDTTTALEARALSDALGVELPCGFTAPKIAWMKRHEPELWASVRSVLLPHDYLNLRLTGQKTMEHGDASGTGFFDPIARIFDRRAMALVDARLESLLPPLVPPGRAAGRLSAEGAALTGFPAGIVVSAGGGDNMMSAIGSGATAPGVFVVSLGTSGTVFAYSDRAVIDPRGAIAAFCDSTGGWLPLLCVMNMTGVANEIAAMFGGDHAALTAEAAAEPAGAGGLVLLPYFAGERVPDLPDARGVLAGIRPGLLRRGSLYRAALEGTTASLALGVDRMRALGLEPRSVRLTGGGARNPLWAQLVADLLGVEAVCLEEPESAALGAAIQAAWVYGREHGEAASVSELAGRCVKLGAVIVPRSEHAETYASLKRELATLTERVFSGASRRGP